MWCVRQARPCQSIDDGNDGICNKFEDKSQQSYLDNEARKCTHRPINTRFSKRMFVCVCVSVFSFFFVSSLVLDVQRLSHAHGLFIATVLGWQHKCSTNPDKMKTIIRFYCIFCLRTALTKMLTRMPWHPLRALCFFRYCFVFSFSFSLFIYSSSVLFCCWNTEI